jgi:hypothetical protein
MSQDNNPKDNQTKNKPAVAPANAHIGFDLLKPSLEPGVIQGGNSDQDANDLSFMLNGSPFVCIDLKNCVNPKTGHIEKWAVDTANELNSYAEIAPGGTALQIFALGRPPGEGREKDDIGMYDSGYLTVTGRHVEGAPTTVEARQDKIEALYKERFGERPKTETSQSTTTVTGSPSEDAELLEKARQAANGNKFDKLFSGQWDDYPSQSEADLALCCQLAFWTGNNAERMDALFRQSGLYRQKWDDPHHSNGNSYGAETIRRAIATSTETYAPEGRDSTSATREESAPLDEETRIISPFPEGIEGLAWDFATTYSGVLEAPASFFFMAFLTCLGSVIKVTLATELKPQPRLYTLLLGKSADDRKSTAIAKTVDFFKEAVAEFFTCRGVGSAEGLQKRLKETPSLLVCLDEFKQFVSKCKIESSVLLPCVNTLFESNKYENSTSKSDIKVDQGHLSILAASTIETYERTWDASFTDIGFNNRLFLVPGSAEKKFPFPAKIPESEKSRLKTELGSILKRYSDVQELELTASARSLYDDWYKNRERSIHAKRLDTYALRLMILLSVSGSRDAVDDSTVKQALALCDWQLAVRKLHDPIDADNKVAAMEVRIRRQLRIAPQTDRNLKRGVHAERAGLWLYSTAINNLEKAKEIRRDKVSQKWVLI